MPQSNNRVLNPRSRSVARAITAREAEEARTSALLRLGLALFTALALLATVLMTSAHAQAPLEPVPDRTAQAMQTIISAQIDAFRNDDADAAYAYASPAIKMRFPTASRFVSMVQEGYPAVYSPQSFTFLETAMTPRGPAQRVEFVGMDGQVWGGIYTFLEGDDGGLTISGVFLRRENERQI